MHDQVDIRLGGGAVPELDHLPELPGGVHVEQRERKPPGEEGLTGQVQEDGRVLADRVQHHRSFQLGDDLTHDVDGLGLQLSKVGEAQLGGQRCGRNGHWTDATGTGVS